MPLQWAQLTKTVHTARLGLEFVFFMFFLNCMICLYVGVCFVLPWTVVSFPFMFWRWRNKLKWAPFEFFAPPLSDHEFQIDDRVCCMTAVTDTRISVFLGSRYFGDKVEGLCGNYNGLSSDDFGADTSLASSLAEQAAAWKTIPSCPEPDMNSPEDPCEVRQGSRYSLCVIAAGGLNDCHTVREWNCSVFNMTCTRQSALAACTGANPIQDSRADIQSSPWWRTTVPEAVHIYWWCPWSTGTAFCWNQAAGVLSVRLSTVGSRGHPVAAAQIWSSLPEHIVSASTLQSFRRHLKTFLLQQYFCL